MYISTSLYLKWFQRSILVSFLCVYCSYSQLSSNSSLSTTYLSYLKNKQQQWNSLSPIEFLTDIELVNQNIKTYFGASSSSQILAAKQILDQLRSEEWKLNLGQAKYFKDLLNSKIFAKASLQKYINHCINLLDHWFKTSDYNTARYFFHAFHLLLNPPAALEQENLLFSNHPETKKS